MRLAFRPLVQKQAASDHRLQEALFSARSLRRLTNQVGRAMVSMAGRRKVARWPDWEKCAKQAWDSRFGHLHAACSKVRVAIQEALLPEIGMRPQALISGNQLRAPF